MAKSRSIMAVGGVGEDPIKKVSSSVDNSGSVPRTKKIVLVQGGVQDGKTGKPSSYVYERLPTDKGFDVKKHRETVYNEHLGDLRKTPEYQSYRKGLSTKK